MSAPKNAGDKLRKTIAELRHLEDFFVEEARASKRVAMLTPLSDIQYLEFATTVAYAADLLGRLDGLYD